MRSPQGITPACAGKSKTAMQGLAAHKDHPRMRGEKSPQVYPIRRPQGSPPHARGKALLRQRYQAERGITPACAGKRTWVFWVFRCLGDHPRMRGEKPFYANDTRQSEGSPPHARGKVEHSLRAADVLGSPPHARGKVHLQRFHGQIHGITPACAGKRCNP